MSWYAVDAIDDSLDATKAFLFPFSLGRWARLALITLFLGGGGAGVQNVLQYANSAGQYAGGGTGSGSSSGSSFALATLSGGTFGPNVLAQAVPPAPGGLPFGLGLVGSLVVAAVALLVLLFVIASPVFEFVFVDAIATDDPRIRGPFARNVWKGIRLLVFRIVLTLVFALPIVAVAAAAFLSVEGGTVPHLGLPVILALVALGAVWMLVFAVVMGFTDQFVVPVMYVDDAGVLAGWSEVWSLLGGEKRQTLVYLLVHLLVGIGVSIVSGLLALVALIPIAIVALVVGLAAGAVVGGTAGTNLGLGVGVLAGLAVGLPLYFVFVALPLNVLTQTYLRTYELASLAGFAARYDTLGRYRDDGDDEGDGGVRGDGDLGDDDDNGGGDGGDDSNGSGANAGFEDFVPADELVEDDSDDGGTAGDRTLGTGNIA